MVPSKSAVPWTLKNGQTLANIFSRCVVLALSPGRSLINYRGKRRGEGKGELKSSSGLEERVADSPVTGSPRRLEAFGYSIRQYGGTGTSVDRLPLESYVLLTSR
ncbi:hypothetical protein M0804_004370 [Polistes exclamans]|nr:hypothetical protein M0804_004370 [Polistes exclamans]